MAIRLRDAAAHPEESPEAPVPHSLGTNTAPEQVDYSTESATRAVELALSVLGWCVIIRPTPSFSCPERHWTQIESACSATAPRPPGEPPRPVGAFPKGPPLRTRPAAAVIITAQRLSCEGPTGTGRAVDWTLGNGFAYTAAVASPCALIQPPGTPVVPPKVKITATRNATHDKTTRAVRPVGCVTRETCRQQQQTQRDHQRVVHGPTPS